jgi:thiamine pyrophosphate-dependent acetolactate synthase large subunit-like protein
MKVGAAIAEVLKREGVEVLTGYPVNHLIEFAAAADIRPVMVRQERIGRDMAHGKADHRRDGGAERHAPRVLAPAQRAAAGYAGSS